MVHSKISITRKMRYNSIKKTVYFQVNWFISIFFFNDLSVSAPKSIQSPNWRDKKFKKSACQFRKALRRIRDWSETFAIAGKLKKTTNEWLSRLTVLQECSFNLNKNKTQNLLCASLCISIVFYTFKINLS